MDTMHKPENDATSRVGSYERVSDRELVATRSISGPARIVWSAWTTPELMKRWWVPASFPITLTSIEQDVRVGGQYRLEFDFQGQSAAFFGRYLEVTPPTRLSWTNDEGETEQVTTVTFDEADGRTQVTVHELFASKEALDEAIASGSTAEMSLTLAQLEELVTSLAAE